MKIRLDEKEGLAADTAIEIDGKESRTPSSVVTVGIWNGERYASVELTAERARQIAAALIGIGGGGGHAR
jgi:hypothetical protein